MTWAIIAALSLGAVRLKIVGPLLAGGAEPPAPLNRVIELLTPALLASLVISSTFGDGRHLIVDSRSAGVLLGAILLLLRVPLLVALVAAASTAAAVQAFS